jgi:response regulator of citrate/malate metabolism
MRFRAFDPARFLTGVHPLSLSKRIFFLVVILILIAVGVQEASFTADDVVRDLSFSRITARRYLEHLAARGQLLKSFQYKKGGRPTLVYSKNKDREAFYRRGSSGGGSTG